MTESRHLDVDSLLAHSTWLARLARSLVSDTHAAEDLVQASLLAAMQRPPGDRTNPRRWLAAILRHAASRWRKRNAWRAAWEQGAANVEPVMSAADSVARLEIQKLLLQLVLALSEPYRTTIIQRFFDGLTPRAIARNDGVPVATVHTRSRRALALLRARLEERHRPRGESWFAVLAPLASLSRRRSIAALLVSVPVLGWVVLIGSSAILWRISVGVAPNHVVATRVAPSEGMTHAAESRAVEAGDATPAGTESRHEMAAPAPADEEPAQIADHARLRVRVVARETGQPMLGIKVVCRPQGADLWSFGGNEVRSVGEVLDILTTDEQGAVTGIVPAGQVHQVAVNYLFAQRAGQADVRVTGLAAGEVHDLTIELPTTNDLHFCGTVVREEDGRPIAGAIVVTSGVESFEEKEGEIPADQRFSEAVTAMDGSFACAIPSWTAVRVEAWAPGYAHRAIVGDGAHETSEAAARLELRKSASVQAVVIARNGRPCGGVEVRATSLGYGYGLFSDADFTKLLSVLKGGGDLMWSRTTDAEGKCAFPDLPSGTHVEVQLEPFRDGRRIPGDPVTLQLEPGEHRTVELRFGGAAVSGSIVDERNQPVAHQLIWLVRTDDGPRFLDPLLDQDPETVSSDDSGRFVFPDVPAGSWLIGPGPGSDENQFAALGQQLSIAPEATAVTVLIQAERLRTIRGRVVEADGEPLPTGVSEKITLSVSWSESSLGEPILLDREGAFVAKVPRAPCRIEARWTRFLPSTDGLVRPPQSMVVEAGDQEVVLPLRDAGAIRVRTVDALTGAPVDATCSLVRTDGMEAEEVQCATMDPGEVLIGQVGPATYHLLATANGRAAIRRSLVVPTGTETRVEIALERAGKLHLIGVEPLDRILVRSGATVVGCLHFFFEAPEVQLPPGAYTIERHPIEGASPIVKTVTITAGDEAHLNLSRSD